VTKVFVIEVKTIGRFEIHLAIANYNSLWKVPQDSCS
jgi:hypothetical protein